MPYEGSLAESPFPQVLQRIGRSAETGILTLQGKDEIIGVTFLDGEVVSVDAVNQAPEDGLGFILEESGLILRDEFTTLVAENQAGGGRVIDLLVERGYVSRQQLLDALRQQALRLCAAACSWQEGQFRFYRGDQVSYEHGIEPVNVDDLLARLAAPDGEPAPVEPEVSTPEPAALDRLEAIDEELVDFESMRLESIAPRAVHAQPLLPPVEMPDSEAWDEPEVADAGFELPEAAPKPWFDFAWESLVAPVMPGRLLGIGMLVSLVTLVVLAPERFLVPLDGQERIRSAVATGTQTALYGKIDRAARTYFLLRGAFPSRLAELVDLDLLDASDLRLSRGRQLSFTAAPVSYQLAIESGARVESAIVTETIGGNFLLDPDFSPPQTVDIPPLVLLD